MTTITDNFDRADSASLGGDWTEANGDAEIFSNTLRIVTGGFTNVIIAHNTALAGVEQFCKVQLGADVQYPIVAFRYTDASSPFYVLFIDGNAGTVEWARLATASASSTTIEAGGSLGGNVAGGADTCSFTITGTGTSTVVRGWRNTTANAPSDAATWDGVGPAFTMSADPASPVNTGNKVAIGGTQGGAGSVLRINNFWAGDIAGGGGIAAPANFRVQ